VLESDPSPALAEGRLDRPDLNHILRAHAATMSNERVGYDPAEVSAGLRQNALGNGDAIADLKRCMARVEPTPLELHNRQVYPFAVRYHGDAVRHLVSVEGRA
jgi:hypothetical protein